MIVADTHSWIYYLSENPALSPLARRRLDAERETSEILVSTISIWEFLLLTERSRLELRQSPQAWLQACDSLPFLRYIPIDAAVVVESRNLPKIHADPADRFILATAKLLNVPVVSKDERFKLYPDISVVW